MYTNTPQCTAWNGSKFVDSPLENHAEESEDNIGGSTKRSVGMAMQVGIGNLGGIIASYVFLPRDAPQFRTGHALLVGLCGMSLILSTLMTLYLRRENARRDREHKRPEEYTSEERAAERELGDNASFFRYMI